MHVFKYWEVEPAFFTSLYSGGHFLSDLYGERDVFSRNTFEWPIAFGDGEKNIS
jgi:hypothetical protein